MVDFVICRVVHLMMSTAMSGRPVYTTDVYHIIYLKALVAERGSTLDNSTVPNKIGVIILMDKILPPVEKSRICVSHFTRFSLAGFCASRVCSIAIHFETPISNIIDYKNMFIMIEVA